MYAFIWVKILYVLIDCFELLFFLGFEIYIRVCPELYNIILNTNITFNISFKYIIPIR